MDKFKNRLKYYMVGFSMGIIAVVFFFGQRGCAWLPDNRIKNIISENKIILGDSIQDILNCISSDSEPIFNLLNYDGDVDFSESDTRSVHKSYSIEGGDGIIAMFKINEEDSYSELIALSKENQTCLSNKPNKLKHALMLPRKIIHQIIEGHQFFYYPEVEELIICYSIPKDTLKVLHLKGVNYISPENDEMVNRIFHINTVYNGNSYEITYEIGENRTRIKNIKGEFPCESN